MIVLILSLVFGSLWLLSLALVIQSQIKGKNEWREFGFTTLVMAGFWLVGVAVQSVL